jgi:hypothetical protein
MLFPVSWTPLIMYEASPSAYPSGVLMLGKNKVTKELRSDGWLRDSPGISPQQGLEK